MSEVRSAMMVMDDLKLSGKCLLIREDFNVPLKDGVITDDTRIRAALPTIRKAIATKAKVLLMSHLGRPTEGQPDEALSLAPVAARLGELLGYEVRLEKAWLDGVEVGEAEVVLCENVRFEVGEKTDDDDLARRMAAVCDIYVADAFATAHRAQASTHAVAKYAREVCAGPLLSAELEALGKALEAPAKPVIAIVGGAKVSSKLQVLESLLGKVDQLIVGGGIANTFLKASGHAIGKSLCEDALVPVAKTLLDQAREQGRSIPMPVDVVCAKEFSEAAPPETKRLDAVEVDDLILDIGPNTAAMYVDLLGAAKTIVWNGPVGVFEFDSFAAGTEALARAVAESDAFSIAGGGDTVAAISKYRVAEQISYISTGGGAFLEFLEGKELPTVAILSERARAHPSAVHVSEGY